MQRQIGAIMLVAGTCIGGGMIALPMILSALGLVPSILLMFAVWLLVYYTSLVSVELNLQAGTGLSLGELGRKFSGKIAEIAGVSSIKLLSYALLSVYIYAGSSIIKEMLDLDSFNNVALCYALAAILLLALPLKLMDYINRILFIGLIMVILILILDLVSAMNWSNLPLFSDNYKDLSLWRIILPVIFTSFGFQVIFHSLTNYCNKDVSMLKRAFFWGSLIPAIVYTMWVSSVLSVVYFENPTFYMKMAAGKAEVGNLVKELSAVAKWKFVQVLIWWISLLAIVTSVLGVGMGLSDSLKRMMTSTVHSKASRNILAAIITILPAYLVAILVPNAFMVVLSFAGMILVLIAILLPIYLLKKARFKELYYSELKGNIGILLSSLAGILIIICAIINMS
jgi:tyrosine-specific transport protein